MMKFFFILLIFISSCHWSTAKDDTNKHYALVLSNDNAVKIKPQEYDNISIELIEISPFIQNLIDFGSQAVVGHAGDSMILEESNLFAENSKPFSAMISEGEDLSITTNVLISINSWITIYSHFTVSFDPASYNRKLLSFSFEWQNSTDNYISGYNISYEGNQDLYKVIPLNGLHEIVTYKAKNLSDKTTTYSSEDFKEKFSNWTSLNASEIYDNQTLQYGFNEALRTLRAVASDPANYGRPVSLISPNYDDLNITKMHSIYTLYIPEVADVFRYDFNFQSTNQSGRAVCVVYCSFYTQKQPYTWPSEYPELPLTILPNGYIISNSESESIAAEAYFETLYGEESNQEGEEEEMALEDSAESNTTSSQPTKTPLTKLSNFNCLYAQLRYDWLLEFARTDEINV